MLEEARSTEEFVSSLLGIYAHRHVQAGDEITEDRLRTRWVKRGGDEASLQTALSILRKRGHLVEEPWGHWTLTEAGATAVRQLHPR